MITVTFYPLDTERYGRSFVRDFPDTATWERVKASLTGTYHSIEVSYPPDGSNYHDHLCRCPGCDLQPPDEPIIDEENYHRTFFDGLDDLEDHPF